MARVALLGLIPEDGDGYVYVNAAKVIMVDGERERKSRGAWLTTCRVVLACVGGFEGSTTIDDGGFRGVRVRGSAIEVVIAIEQYSAAVAGGGDGSDCCIGPNGWHDDEGQCIPEPAIVEVAPEQ